MIELSSVARGVVVADAMVKASPIGSMYAGSVHPGNYLVLVGGDTASVEEAMRAGVDAAVGATRDSLVLPDIAPSVVAAITATSSGAEVGREAVGIVETTTVAGLLRAADAGVKSANVTIAGIRLADGLGGKAYVVFAGEIGDIEFAVDTAAAATAGTLVESQVIALISVEVAAGLAQDLSFGGRMAALAAERDR